MRRSSRVRMSVLLVAALALAGSAGAGSAGAGSAGAGSAPEVTKVDRWTTKVLFHDVHVLVGVRHLAVKHKPYKYLPLQISIANYGKPTVQAHLKNFHLEDGEGNDYPVAPHAEVQAEHGLLQYDRERARAFGFEQLDQTPARQVDPRFYPRPGETADAHIELLKGERLVDFLYFRDAEQRAPTKLILTIEGLVDAPALRIPLEVP